MAHADKVMSKLSRYISRELELVIGSEEVIKTRQQVIAEANVAASQASEYYHNWVCGSKSEGFRLPGQDLDVMAVMKHIPVYDYQSKIPTEKFCLRLLYGACYTGSVMLEVFSYIDHSSEHPMLEVLDKCCNKYNHRHVLNASKLKRILYDEFLTGEKQSGPIKNILNFFDFAIAFQTNFWPKCAQEWVNRNRKYNWPCEKEFDQQFKEREYAANISPILYATILLFSSCNGLGDVPGCLTAVWELKRQAQLLCSSDSYLIETGLIAQIEAPIICCIGVCYEILGDEVKAKLKYVKAIDILPQYSPAINRFRELLKRSSINTDCSKDITYFQKNFQYNFHHIN